MNTARYPNKIKELLRPKSTLKEGKKWKTTERDTEKRREFK